MKKKITTVHDELLREALDAPEDTPIIFAEGEMTKEATTESICEVVKDIMGIKGMMRAEIEISYESNMIPTVYAKLKLSGLRPQTEVPK